MLCAFVGILIYNIQALVPIENMLAMFETGQVSALSRLLPRKSRGGSTCPL